MATIVYDGVGGGGSLFEGIKFCFLQRVPSRQRWVDIVQSNGGEIVKLEKQADLIIADHARKDCPAGSISWTYVQDSAKYGELEDIEKHRAGPVGQVAREVGSNGPTRKGRTPFTNEDDRILMKWVLQGEKAGISVKGNELFKQLEEKNNRHSFQSWRDRWIKYVQFHPRPQAPEESPSPSTPGPIKPPRKTHVATSSSRNTKLGQHKPEAPRGTAEPVGSKRRGSAGSNEYGARRVPASSSPNPWVAKSARGMDFDTEEIQLLVDAYDDIINIHEDMAIDAWAAWSVEYPTHTPQEWRNYFVKELAPLIRKKTESEFPVKPHLPNSNRPSKGTGDPRAPASRSYSPEFETTFSQPELEPDIDPSLLDEELFKREVAILAAGFNVQVMFDPVIAGRRISLFSLWQTVKSDFGGGDEVTGLKLWHMVARKLNFGPDQQASAAEELESCYGEILVDFEQARDEWYGNITGSQEDAMIEAQLSGEVAAEKGEDGREEDDEEDIDGDLEAPVSSSSKKRISDQTKQDLTAIAGPINKRQRIDKGKGKELEIPSTPEEVFNSGQMPRKSHQPSPLKSIVVINDENEDSDTEFLTTFKKPDQSFLNPVRRFEPETQDFHYLFQEDDVVEVEDEADWATESPSKGRGAGRDRQTESPEPRVGSLPDLPEGLQEFVDHHVSLGYAEALVWEALASTTMNTANASIVMENLNGGRGIPEDLQGVWTLSDDAALEAKDRPAFMLVMAKHGKTRVEERLRFLEEQREVREGLIDGDL